MAEDMPLAALDPAQEVLLVLIASPRVEDALVDWLLRRDDLSGFSTQRLEGHSATNHHLSIAEQVAGRQRQVMFHLHAPSGVVLALLEALRVQFAGVDLHYWVVPALAAGSLG